MKIGLAILAFLDISREQGVLIVVNEQLDNAPSLALNFLPVTFSDHKVAGFILDYEDEVQLRNLQDRYKDQFLLRRVGRKINAVPLVADYMPLHDNSVAFSMQEDWSLFSR